MPVALSVSPSLLRPNPWNTNFVSPENEEKLLASMRRFKLFKPIIVREIEEDGETVYEILGGEHRWEGAKRLGYTEVPIMNLGAISDTEAKEISLADNARYGSDDSAALAALLSELGSTDDLQSFLPFTNPDLKSIFAASDIALDDLELDDPIAETVAEPQDEPEAKPAKTHVIMRFKVSIADSETIAEKVARTKKEQGFTSGDDLTNAGDALVHLLIGGGS